MPGFTGRGTTGLTPILTDEKLVVFDVSLFAVTSQASGMVSQGESVRDSSRCSYSEGREKVRERGLQVAYG